VAKMCIYYHVRACHCLSYSLLILYVYLCPYARDGDLELADLLQLVRCSVPKLLTIPIF
jgi:hypothetical protein